RRNVLAGLLDGVRVQPCLGHADPATPLDQLFLRARQLPVAIVEPRLVLVELALARQHAIRLALTVPERALLSFELRDGDIQPGAAFIELQRCPLELRAPALERLL